MAIRRLNFTDRQRLLRDDTLITLRAAEGEVATFDAELQLREYSFPPDACVVVEAYRQSTVMRFDFGTVGRLQAPGDRHLREFSASETVMFRVKVISLGGRRGQILGEGDRIRVVAPGEVPERRMALLPVEGTDLDEILWRLDFGADDEPRLLVNERVGDWRAAAKSPQFMLLVYPLAFEQILTRILIIDEHFSDEDLSDWRSRWLSFAYALPGVSEPPGEDDGTSEMTSWIQGAVLAFGRANRLRHRFGAMVLEGAVS